MKDIHLKQIFRLGKRSDKPRPLKLVLGSENEASEILKRTYRLKGQDVRILRDLSPEDREKLKAALKELHEKRANGDNEWMIKDFQVIRKRPRIRWHLWTPPVSESLKETQPEILGAHMDMGSSSCTPIYAA